MPETAAVETDTAVQVARPGRAWLPALSISCSGITLSDEGGQEERTRTRRYAWHCDLDLRPKVAYRTGRTALVPPRPLMVDM